MKSAVLVVSEGKKSRKSDKSASRHQARINRGFDRLHGINVTYRRIMSYSDASINTTAGGIIGSTNLCDSQLVQSCADWSSCAAMYSSFRVRAIKAYAFPAYRVNTTAVTVPAMVYVIPFYGNLIPTTIPGFADSSEVKIVSGYDKWSHAADFLTLEKDGDAHLWTPTNTTVTSAERFGLAIMGTATASTASTLVWKLTYFFDVEFKAMA
jgi:hypothetical protein